MINPVITNAIEIMETYKKYKDAPLPIREGMCIKVQYPGLLPGPRKGDIFAGRCRAKRITHVGSFAFVGTFEFTPENESYSKIGGFLFDYTARYTMELSAEELKLVEELEEFWKKESNQAKVEDSDLALKSGTGFTGATNLDIVVKRGLPGLKNDVLAMPGGDFRTGMLLLLESIDDVCRFYLKTAEEIGNEEVAETMRGLPERAPATVAEALQLILILELLFHERHYEVNRLDLALGDLYVKELEEGTLTEEQGVRLIRGFYETINENGDATVCRLVMGGRGRRNAEKADRFIKAALKATQLHKQVTPQVTIRIYEDMNPDILALTYDTIRETGTFPLLHNDDAVIPSVAKAFDISLKEAESYYPLGCGEFILAPHGPALLLTSWDIPRTLDEAIRGSNAENFEDLYKAFMEHVNIHANHLAHFIDAVRKIHNSQSAFLMASLVINDCIKRNKPVLDGGARYIGTSVMGHGYTNAADGLTAIKKLVYEKKCYTLAQIFEAIDANFEGYEDIHKAILAVPKYGNDDVPADEMLARLWSDELITKERNKFEALFAAYWASGGQQASFAIIKRGDLEAALKEPHKYPNLMVRMGGWTARFVELEPYIQEEILTRTLH